MNFENVESWKMTDSVLILSLFKSQQMAIAAVNFIPTIYFQLRKEISPGDGTVPYEVSSYVEI